MCREEFGGAVICLVQTWVGQETTRRALVEDYPPAQAAGYPPAQAVALLRVLGVVCQLGPAEGCLLAQEAAYQLGQAAVCRPGLGEDYLPVLAEGFQQGPAADYRADLEGGYQQGRHLITATFRQGRSTSRTSRNTATAGHTRFSAKRGASNKRQVPQLPIPGSGIEAHRSHHATLTPPASTTPPPPPDSAQ